MLQAHALTEGRDAVTEDDLVFLKHVLWQSPEQQPEIGKALARIGIPQVAEPGSFVCALGVPDAVEAKRGLSKAVHAGLLDEINSLRGDLGRLSESGDRLREKTIAQRLVIYKRLKAKADSCWRLRMRRKRGANGRRTHQGHRAMLVGAGTA